LTDEELVERYRAAPACVEGESFLNLLFERYHTRVAVWCHRMTGEVNSAADLAQEVFLKAFQRLDSFRGESSFSTWLYSIARNRCMDEFRSRAVRPNEATDIAMDRIVDPRLEEPSRAMERRESEQILKQLIRESLDETEAKVITLHYVHELPLSSITRLLGLDNPSGAKAFIVSARRKLDRIVQRKGLR
jgi:RNA polymerase sigma-70 factor (ECF subfamily)